MCGIVGYLGSFAPPVLGAMNRRQGHRGPDGSGEWQRGRVGLAHVRLSILDLSANGAQPMADLAGRVVLTLNGEIYHYRELRRRLEREGVAFRGESDTEVLLQLLAHHGTKCLPWLNGIFAFAAWFPAEARLFDDYGKVFYGSSYIAIITLPTPRVWWPNKPGLADHTIEISTIQRPYSIEGRISTYIAESYANFRYLGLIGMPLLLGYFFTRWCLRATSGPVQRFEGYLYTAFSMAYFQLFHHRP